MKRIIMILILIIVIVLSLNYVIKMNKLQNKNLANIYLKIIDYALDKDFLIDKKYIALDGKTLVNIDESEKKEILKRLQEKYKVGVIDANYSDILDKQLDTSEYTYIRIEDVKNYIFKMKIQIGIAYAPLGGEGTIVEISFKDGKWIITDTKPAWIS